MAKLRKIDEAIGEAIRGIRKTKKTTQEELADSLNLSRASIVNIEQGRQSLTISNLYRICIALDCSLSDILPSLVVMMENKQDR